MSEPWHDLVLRYCAYIGVDLSGQSVDERGELVPAQDRAWTYVNPTNVHLWALNENLEELMKELDRRATI